MNPHEYDQRKFLPVDIEVTLSRLIYCEVLLHAQLKAMAYRLSQTYGFTVDGAFKAIVDWNYPYMDGNNLSRFLKSTFRGTKSTAPKLSATGSSLGGSARLSSSSAFAGKFDSHSQLILAILRRFDQDGRGFVSFYEFKKELGYGQSRDRVGAKSKARPKSAGPSKVKQLRNLKKKKVGTLALPREQDFAGPPKESFQQSMADMTEIDRQFEY